MINEDSLDESEDSIGELKDNRENQKNIEDKFFRNAEKIPKNKKNFKFISKEDSEDEDDIGEFFKEQPLTSTEKFDIKKQVKRLRIKLLKLLSEGNII